MIHNDYLAEFDFYGDKVSLSKHTFPGRFSLWDRFFFFFTGVHDPSSCSQIISYARVSFELKRFVDDFFDFFGVLMQLDEDDKSDAGKFLVWGSVATGLPAGLLLLMAVLSALSFINHSLPR